MGCDYQTQMFCTEHFSVSSEDTVFLTQINMFILTEFSKLLGERKDMISSIHLPYVYKAYNSLLLSLNRPLVPCPPHYHLELFLLYHLILVR